MPWKNKQRLEFLDVSTNSLNKVIFSKMQQNNNNNLKISLNNSISSDNLLSNNEIINDQIYQKFNSCFFNKQIQLNKSIKSKKISIPNDRAHSCHNLLVLKNTDDQNSQYETNKKKNFYQKIDHSMLSVQKIEPAPKLPNRHQNLSNISNNNPILKFETNKNEIETDYDNLSSIKLLNNFSSNSYDCDKFLNNNNIYDSKINKKNDFISKNSKYNLIDQHKKKQEIRASITKKNVTNKINKDFGEEIYNDITKFTKQKPLISLLKPLQILPKIDNNTNQILKKFCDYILTSNLREIAFLITEQDYKMFCIKQEVNKLI